MNERWESPDAAKSVFRLLPSLTHLKLSFPDYFMESDTKLALFDSMDIHLLGDLAVLANLRTLGVRGYVPHRPHYEKLVDILSARCGSTHLAMHSFQLIWRSEIIAEARRFARSRGQTPSYEPEPHIIATLQTLVTDGMEIRIGENLV
ncbi:hypothetical protein B0H19DRAFT_1267513 [Mycena capillaripes]|nr:hypothetical protein B0H19DRAFT_1267513 [Mycena capillaripes]